MLEVTSEALRYLLRSLQERHAPANVAMRLCRTPNGLEVAPDQERPGDRGFDFDDRTVLVVDKTLLDDMGGQRLCVVQTPSGQADLCLEPS